MALGELDTERQSTLSFSAADCNTQPSFPRCSSDTGEEMKLFLSGWGHDKD